MSKVQRDLSEVMSLYKIPATSRSSQDVLALLHKIQNIVSTSLCPDAEKQYLQSLAHEVYTPHYFTRGEDFVIKRLFLEVFGDDVQEAYLRINPKGSPEGDNSEAVIEKAKKYGYVGKDPLKAAAYTLSLLEEVSSLNDKEGRALFGKGFTRENIEAFLEDLDVTQLSTVQFSEERAYNKLAAFALKKYKEGIEGPKPTLILAENTKKSLGTTIIKRAIMIGDTSLVRSALEIFTPFIADHRLFNREEWVDLIFSSKASGGDKTCITTLLTGKKGFLATQRSSILTKAIESGDLSIVNGCLGAIAFLDEEEKKAILKGKNWQELVVNSTLKMTDRVNISYALHDSGVLFTKDHFVGLFASEENPTAFLSLYAKKLPLADKMDLLRIAVQLKRVDIVRFFVEDPDFGYSKGFKFFISKAPTFFIKHTLQDLFPDSISSADRNYTIFTQKGIGVHELGVKVILQKSSESSDLETLKQLSQNPGVDPVEKAYIKLITTEIYRRCQKRHENSSALDFIAKGRLEEITKAYRVINPVDLSNKTKDVFKTVLWNKEMCIDKLKKELVRAQRYGYLGDNPLEGEAHIEALMAEIDSLSTDSKNCFSPKKDALEILEDPEFDVNGYQKFIDEIPCRIERKGPVVFTRSNYNMLAKFILEKVRRKAVLKKIEEVGSPEGILKSHLLRGYFVQAAGGNYVETVELFLKMGAPVYWQSEALQAAIENGHFKLVELLATKDMLRNQKDLNLSILSTAISFSGDSAVKLAILNKLFEIGWTCSDRDKWLILASNETSPEIIRLFADKLTEGILDKPMQEKQLEMGQMILAAANSSLKEALRKKREDILRSSNL